jgi:hypothetical protein
VISATGSLPDAVCLREEDGGFLFAANKRARRVLNKGFEGRPPLWSRIARTPGNILNSPEYRAIQFDTYSMMCAMLTALHNAGLKSLFYCEGCKGLHPVDADNIEAITHVAISGSEGVMPAHRTVQ